MEKEYLDRKENPPDRTEIIRRNIAITNQLSAMGGRPVDSKALSSWLGRRKGEDRSLLSFGPAAP